MGWLFLFNNHVWDLKKKLSSGYFISDDLFFHMYTSFPLVHKVDLLLFWFFNSLVDPHTKNL